MSGVLESLERLQFVRMLTSSLRAFGGKQFLSQARPTCVILGGKGQSLVGTTEHCPRHGRASVAALHAAEADVPRVLIQSRCEVSFLPQGTRGQVRICDVVWG